MMIRTERELEELLSHPSEADCEAVRALGGDLIILGVGGKMGPSLAIRARRAANDAGVKMRVIGVSRFSGGTERKLLEESGVETVAADLLDDEQLRALPDAPNVIYLATRKFGSSDNASLTWAMNAHLPAMAARRYRGSRIGLFSSGNVYPYVPVNSGGATEATAPEPVGEYGWSALARERMFTYFSETQGTPVSILRLNYAVELRYGVLADIGRRVFERAPVDLSMGNVNVIWQGDANSVCLRSIAYASSPPWLMNLTGPETLSVRWIAERFGAHFGVTPQWKGSEGDVALLNNASRCTRTFGYPSVSTEQIIEWTAAWIGAGGRSFNKPTHFEATDGKF